MDSLTVYGGNKLTGKVRVSGAKNVAMKVILASLLTDEKIICHNVPHISSVMNTAHAVELLGAKINFENHCFEAEGKHINNFQIPLEMGGVIRTSTMVMGPLLARFGKAIVPNPGGCRLGARPIDRHIEGLKKMGAQIEYKDGYFHATCEKLKGAEIEFKKITNGGTETLILAAVLAEGKTILKNAAVEPEIDDLIKMLNMMGAKIQRTKERVIEITGVNSLKGVTHEVMPDRNEVVTFAMAAYMTHGDITVENAREADIVTFLRKLDDVGAKWEKTQSGLRFIGDGDYRAVDIVTAPHPGFMTDWQPLWTTFATQCTGKSTIHETVFEDKFKYVDELVKMGAEIELFNPQVENPERFYNFNWGDDKSEYRHGAIVEGPTPLHEAVLQMLDIRAGAAVLIAALGVSSKKKNVIYNIGQLDRGYEKLTERLSAIGGKIKRKNM